MRYRVNLLDTWVDRVDLSEAVVQIEAFISADRPHQIVTANVDFLRLGKDDPTFQDLINTADLVVADGMPLLWASRLLGDPLPERVTGVDLLEACVELSAAKGYRIFFLGAAPGIATAASAVLQDRYPGARIVGSYAPPCGPFSQAENEKMLHMIQEARPDMLFVAFGAPRQDQWIREHMHRLNVPVCMGVGGSFDFVAGRIRRAPMWMQDRGLEWLYRVTQEPGRLWKRYFVDDLPIFLQMLAQPKAGSLGAKMAPAELQTLSEGGNNAGGRNVVSVSGTGVHVA